MPIRWSLLLPLVAATSLVACGGSSSGGATTSTAAPTTSTAAPTTAIATTTAATATTVPAAPVMPLTGEPITDPALASRPAVVVKVGNYDAHAQRGMNQADIVYEELINANISRFALVFQSHTANEVGPIRSGRRQDVDLLGSLNKPIFAWAGGNATVTHIIKSSDLVDLSQFKCHGSCFRVTDDVVPYNLVFNVARIYDLHLPGAGTPPQQFDYLATGEAAAGAPSPGVDLRMDAYKVSWEWNARKNRYERFQNGGRDLNWDRTQATTDNVVVLEMVYKPGISNSPDAQSIGTGTAWVFTAGRMVKGTWTRSDRLQPFTLTAADGSLIKLTPGRTFIELPRAGSTTPKH
jgi:hypothetical protein